MDTQRFTETPHTAPEVILRCLLDMANRSLVLNVYMIEYHRLRLRSSEIN